MFRTMDIDQIMSRYKPIAPKPRSLFESPLNDQNSARPSPPLSPPRIRPGRPRKKAKTINSSSTPQKTQPHFTKFSPYVSSLSQRSHLGPPLQGFGYGFHRTGLIESPRRTCGGLVAALPLPAYACSNMEGISLFQKMEGRVLDLNCRAAIPQEKDLLQKLQTPLSGWKDSECRSIITPQPVRPIGSSISVECICGHPTTGSPPPVSQTSEEVEQEMESEALPSVVSDSNHRVRLVNSAYKELVGQPECPWLDTMVSEDGRSRARSTRICGEVALVLLDPIEVPISSNRFSCMVKIEWVSNGHNIFINAHADVVRLSCESKNYLFTWKFHTNI